MNDQIKTVPRRVERLLLWSGFAVVAAGLIWHHLWEQWPVNRFAESLIIALVVLGGAWLAGWSWRHPIATKVVVLWVLLLAFFAGALPVLATIVLILAAIALGGLLLPRESAVLQALLGILVLAGVVGWLLPLPVHYGWGYLLLCVLLLRWRWNALLQTLQTTKNAWNEAVATSPRLVTFCVIVIGLVGVGCWLPVLQYDDLSYHLRLPWQLQQQAFYAPMPQYQLWALAPWLADVVYALPQLITGKESVGPVNAFWLCVLGSGLWRLSAQLGASITARWLAATVAISIPMTTALTAGMKTDLPSAAVLAWMFALVAGPRDGRFRFWLTLAILAGGAAAIKTTSCVLAAVPVLWALFRHPWPSATKILAVIATFLTLAGASYVYAWVIADNPVLPLFNEWFQSPYYAPKNFLDVRWKTGFSAQMLWDISFDTNRHVEAHVGANGFVQIALAGLWLLSLIRRNTRTIMFFATAAFLIPLIPIQYVRYAYPGFMVFSAVLATTAFTVDARRAVWLLAGLCVLHLSFQANGSWMLRNGIIKQSILTAGQDEPLFRQFAPERAISLKIRQQDGRAGNVLFLDAPFAAEFGIHGRVVNWYSQHLLSASRAANQDPSGQRWVSLLRDENIRDVVVNSKSVHPAQQEALQIIGGTQQAAIGRLQWWYIPRESK